MDSLLKTHSKLVFYDELFMFNKNSIHWLNNYRLKKYNWFSIPSYFQSLTPYLDSISLRRAVLRKVTIPLEIIFVRRLALG